MIEDEEFYAWLDGELEGEAAARIAAKVAASPELRAKADQHREMEARLRVAFDPVIMEASTPPRFDGAPVIDLGARATQATRRGNFGVPQWAAMAATLALGLLVGNLVGERFGAPVQNRDGSLVAAASLDRALDQQLAANGVSNGVRVGLTFRDHGGSICRSFNDGAASGLACRDNGDWRIRGLFQGGEGQGGDYRMAAGEDPRLAALIDETIVGEPFDSSAEKAALERDWR
jgi:hypothetical protein